MKDMLKKYWWILLLIIILVPCVINYIMVQPRICEITGNDTSWLSFWGGYIGSIISSSIAVIILWKQLQQNHKENDENRNQNHKENDENRKLQLKNIEYQQKTQWLNLLRSKFADYYSAFCFNDLAFLGKNIMNKEYKSNIRNELKVMIDRMINADFNVEILFPENIDSDEKRLLLEIKKITQEFYAMLCDLDWYTFYVANLTGSFEMNQHLYIERTDKYMIDANKYDLSHDRIWDIIKANDYNIFDKHKKIISEFFYNAFEVIDFDNVQKHITNLIDYEQNKINKILS